jgi:hypothetical protein
MANPNWMPKWMKWFINRIDDPYDNFKHWFHGLQVCLFNKRWYSCTAYMSSKPGTHWSIKRQDKYNPNVNNTIHIGCKHGNK